MIQLLAVPGGVDTVPTACPRPGLALLHLPRFFVSSRSSRSLGSRQKPGDRVAQQTLRSAVSTAKQIAQVKTGLT